MVLIICVKRNLIFKVLYKILFLVYVFGYIGFCQILYVIVMYLMSYKYMYGCMK